MVRWFLWPMVGHFVLVCLLYVWLTIERKRAVGLGEARVSDFVRVDGDPARSKAIQRNLANQFELPMFAYFAVVFLVASSAITWVDVAATWLFLIGRIAHTAVQTLTSNVALRGQVFMITFVAVAMLMAHVAWVILHR
jgi:hypothetical protein